MGGVKPSSDLSALWSSRTGAAKCRFGSSPVLNRAHSGWPLWPSQPTSPRATPANEFMPRCSGCKAVRTGETSDLRAAGFPVHALYQQRDQPK